MRVYLLQGGFYAVDSGQGKVRMFHLSTKKSMAYSAPAFMQANRQYIVGELEGQGAKDFTAWTGAEV
jgi:hypothetical protein